MVTELQKSFLPQGSADGGDPRIRPVFRKIIFCKDCPPPRMTGSGSPFIEQDRGEWRTVFHGLYP